MAVLSQLWCRNNSVSNLSLYSGCGNWFIHEPVANLRQPEKDLGPQRTLLGRKVLSFLFELNWEPRSAASHGELCEESLPGTQTSRRSRTERWREMESSDIEPLIDLYLRVPQRGCDHVGRSRGLAPIQHWLSQGLVAPQPHSRGHTAAQASPPGFPLPGHNWGSTETVAPTPRGHPVP